MKTHPIEHLRWDRHSTDKPFKCNFANCNRSFTAKSSLQSHIKSHHLTDTGNSGRSYATAMDTTMDRVIPQVCLHNGCTEVFTSQQDLREHIYTSAPGLVSEVSFLKNTLLDILSQINSWDKKSSEEKETLKKYFTTIEEAVRTMPSSTGVVDNVERLPNSLNRNERDDDLTTAISSSGYNLDNQNTQQQTSQPVASHSTKNLPKEDPKKLTSVFGSWTRMSQCCKDGEFCVEISPADKDETASESSEKAASNDYDDGEFLDDLDMFLYDQHPFSKTSYHLTSALIRSHDEMNRAWALHETPLALRDKDESNIAEETSNKRIRGL
jgi:hypothetical protein